MFKLLAKLFKKPIDKLITVTDGQVAIWNGINYSQEYMLKFPDGKWLDPKEHPWIKVAFGQYRSGYGDWCGGDYSCDDMVKFFIDKDLIIRNIIRNSPYYNGPKANRRQERAIDRIMKHLKIGDRFKTDNECLMQWIHGFFNVPVEKRYEHCGSVDDALSREFNPQRLEFILGINDHFPRS